MSGDYQISYRFFANSDHPLPVVLHFDPETFRLILPEDSPRPDWTQLGHRRCPNCPLDDRTTHCPSALGIAMFLPAFANRVSHEKAVIEVETPVRTFVANTTFQTGMAALIGLVCATSGCPLTRFLRPMARYHTPFADEKETLTRSFAIWLLGRYIAQQQQGSDEALSLQGLKDNYAELSAMNLALSNRMRDSVNRDAALNAVVILDLFAQIAPINIDGDFEDIADLYVVEDDQVIT